MITKRNYRSFVGDVFAVIAIFVFFVAGGFCVCASRDIGINVTITNDSIVLSDDINTRIFDHADYSAVLSWRIPSENQTCPNIDLLSFNETLYNINDNILTRCSNLSLAEIKETVNSRLEIRLSDFGDTIDAKLTPLSEYGTKYKVCLDDKSLLEGIISERTLNETELRHTIDLLNVRVKASEDEAKNSNYAAMLFFGLALFGFFLHFGVIQKIKEQFGGKQ